MELKDGYKKTEVGLIPADWDVCPLSAFGELLSSKRIFEEDYVSTGIPFYRGKEISLLIENKPLVDEYFITYERFEAIRKSFGAPARGDILITAVGTLGNVYLIPTDRPFYFKDGNVIWLRQITGIDKRYLKAQLRSLKPYILDNAIGSTQKALTIVVLKKTPIPLPPTNAEQEAIAKALSDADIFIESLEQFISKKRQIKQGAMQELLTGKKRLPGFSGQWEEVCLGEVSTFFKGRGLPKSSLTPSGTDLCIHYGELFTQYDHTIETVISRTNAAADSFRSNANDVLMPTSDVTPRGLAKASCVVEEGVVLGGDILVIRTELRRVNGSFLSCLIRLEEQQVLQLVTGSTVYHLYASDMTNFMLRLPSYDEQTAITTILIDMDAEIAALEAKLAKARQVKQGMMQELLTGSIRLIQPEKTHA